MRKLRKRRENSGTVLTNAGGCVSRCKLLAALFHLPISTGLWKVGEKIPTIKELATNYGVAPETVRQALDILATAKLVERFRAKGTFVTNHSENRHREPLN